MSTGLLPARTRLLNDSGYAKRLTLRQLAALYGRSPEVITEEWERQRLAGLGVFHVPVSWRQTAIARLDAFFGVAGDKDSLTHFVEWAERRDLAARTEVIEPVFSG